MRWIVGFLFAVSTVFAGVSVQNPLLDTPLRTENLGKIKKCTEGELLKDSAGNYVCVSCPAGGVYNNATGQCEASVSLSCPPGSSYNNGTGRCETNIAGGSFRSGLMVDGGLCPPSSFYDFTTKSCKFTLNNSRPVCPAGYIKKGNLCVGNTVMSDFVSVAMMSNTEGGCLDTTWYVIKCKDVGTGYVCFKRVKRVAVHLSGESGDLYFATYNDVSFPRNRSAWLYGKPNYFWTSLYNRFTRLSNSLANRIINNIKDGGYYPVPGLCISYTITMLSANLGKFYKEPMCLYGNLRSDGKCYANPSKNYSYCPLGWRKVGSSCFTKAGGSLTVPSCPSGFTYDSANNVCYSSPAYSCPTGYSYDGVKCVTSPTITQPQ